MVREDTWYDFSFLKFTEVWFVTQDVVYPGECSMYTWEEGVFCIWMEILKILRRSILSNVSFKTCVSLIIFCSDDLSIGMSGLLKSPTIFVLLSISPFMYVNVCRIYWGAPMSGAYLHLLCLSLGLIPWPLYSVLRIYYNLLYFKVYLSDMRIATPAFFCFPLHGIYFPIISLSVYMCL